jgi:hypothetical protein
VVLLLPPGGPAQRSPLADHAWQWASASRIILDGWPGCRRAVVYEYSELTAQTETAIARICDFAQLAMDGRSAAHCRRTAAVRYADGANGQVAPQRAEICR